MKRERERERYGERERERHREKGESERVRKRGQEALDEEVAGVLAEGLGPRGVVTRPLTHPLTHSLTHPLTYSPTHSPRARGRERVSEGEGEGEGGRERGRDGWRERERDQEAVDEEVPGVLAEGLGARGVVVPFEHRQLLVTPILIGGWAFFYGRGTPVIDSCLLTAACRPHTGTPATLNADYLRILVYSVIYDSG